MLTKERIDKHALQAVDCPPATWVVLRSAMHRLVDKESAAVAERDARIAELESDCDRLERYWNEAMATHKNIAELTQQLEEARKDAMHAAALICDALPAPPSCNVLERNLWDVATVAAADAIRAAIKEQT